MAAAALAGYGLFQELLRGRSSARHRASVRGAMSDHRSAGAAPPTSGASLTEGITCNGALERALIEFMALRTLQVRMNRSARRRSERPAATKAVTTLIAKAGLEGVVSPQGLSNARLWLAVAAGASGAAIGLALSAPLALALAAAGLLGGWIAPRLIVKSRAAHRADELEHRLPETLDVIALGLRGGLSFDRSLELYTDHFTSDVATGFSRAENSWVYGLMTRSEALRKLASTYDSPMFARVVENIIRSLRFGSSLAESLESTAVEARQTYQAKKQEQVAKAPIKIMIPTGALILPAMLILVLGPVLLELIESF